MESTLLLGCALICGGTAGFLVVPSGISLARHLSRQTASRLRLEGMEPGAKGLLYDRLRRGVPFLSRPATFVLGRGPGTALIGMLAAFLQFKAPAEQVTEGHVCELFLAVLLGLLVAGLLLFGSLFSGLLMATCFTVFLSMKASKEMNAREELMYAQLPDALDSLGVCFGAGLSIIQAFTQVAEECPAPLSEQFAEVVYDLESGRSTQEALLGLEERSSIPELGFIALALEIQNRTGGSFRPLLEGASQSVTQTLELRQSLSVQTTQARFSARIVALMPLVLMLLLSCLDRDYAVSLFSNAFGWFLIIVAVLLEVCGILMIRRILSVEVGEGL